MQGARSELVVGEGLVETFETPLAAAWDQIRTGLRRDCGVRTFDGWLKPAELGEFDPDTGELVLIMPSKFMADWVRSHFGERLALAWKTVLPIVRDVRIAAAEGGPRPSPLLILEDIPAPAANHALRDPDSPNFDPRYKFSTFVIGKANEVAATAAKTLASADSVSFNPLFIHGGTGRGKTHLLHAIGQDFIARRPTARVVSMSAEKFMVEFVRALRENDTIGFKGRLRSADLLLIDDVQFIAGKDSTQEEFFHTMNDIIDAGHRLVITADRSPQNLEGIQDRILSRMAWGLVADINPADYELRLNILHAKVAGMASCQTTPVPNDVVEFLARKITANVRELEGALNRVVAYAALTGRPVTLDFTRETLADQLRAHEKKLTIDEIQRRVADYYNLKPSDMVSARRAREVARPRQVAMYLAKRLTPRSLPEIGRRFGGRDHTTVMHAVKRIDELRVADRELDADVTRLTKMLDS